MQALSPLCPSCEGKAEGHGALRGGCGVEEGSPTGRADDTLWRYFINTAINIYREATPSILLAVLSPLPTCDAHPLHPTASPCICAHAWAASSQNGGREQQLHPHCAQQMAWGAAVLPHHAATSFPDCSRLRVAGHNIFLFSFPCSPAYFTICCTDF